MQVWQSPVAGLRSEAQGAFGVSSVERSAEVLSPTFSLPRAGPVGFVLGLRPDDFELSRAAQPEGPVPHSRAGERGHWGDAPC